MSLGTKPDFGTTKDSITLDDYLAKYNSSPVEELNFLAPRKTITGKFVPDKKENETMSLGTMEQRTEGMKRQAQDLIEQAYHRGFKAGREDRQDWEKDQADRLIEKGRNEAWEAFKTIHKFAPHCFLDCFPNGNDELYSLSIHEVIRRVHAYEEQKKQEEDERIEVDKEKVIKLADEIGIHNLFAIVKEIWGE